MELQTSNEVLVGGIQESAIIQSPAGAGAAPPSSSSIFLIQIPELDQITKKLDNMIQVQQTADLVISALKHQHAEEQKKRKATQPI